MNGMITKKKLNILPLGFYEVFISMDWLESHRAIINFLEKTFTCIDDEGKYRMVRGIPRSIMVRQRLALQPKKCA